MIVLYRNILTSILYHYIYIILLYISNITYLLFYAILVYRNIFCTITSIFLCHTIPQYTCGIRVDRGAARPHYHRRRLRRHRQRALASKPRRMLRQYSYFCTSKASKVSTLGHHCDTPRSRGRSGPASRAFASVFLRLY